MPLLERVKLCAIVVVEPRRVLRGAGRRAPRRGRSRRPAPHARRADARSRRSPTVATASASSRRLRTSLWLDELRPALAAEKIRVLVGRRAAAPRERASLDAALPTRDRAAADADRGRRGRAPSRMSPSLALNVGVLVRDPLTHEDAVRPRERPRRPAAVPPGRPRRARAARGRDRRTSCRRSSAAPRWRAAASSASPAMPTSRSRDDADDLLEAVETQLLRRRFARRRPARGGRGRTARARRPARARARASTDDQVYDEPRAARSARAGRAVELDRPELKDPRWKPVTRRPFATEHADRACSRRSAAATSSSITRTTPSTRASARSSRRRAIRRSAR